MKTTIRRITLLLLSLPLLSSCTGSGMLIGTGLYAALFVVTMLSSVVVFSVRKCGGWRRMSEANLFCSGIGWYLLIIQFLLIIIFLV